MFHLEYYLVGYYLVSFKFHWSDKMSGANRREPNTGCTNSNVKNKDVLRCKYNFAEIIIGKSQKMIINGQVFFAPAIFFTIFADYDGWVAKKSHNSTKKNICVKCRFLSNLKVVRQKVPLNEILDIQ